MKQLLTFIFLLFTTIGLWSAPADAALIKHINSTNMSMPIYVAPTYTKAVFGGDSWTAGSTLNPLYPKQPWPYWFTNFYCTNLTQTITNPAIPGQTLAQLLANYNALINPYASDATTNGTNAILFLEVGINDIWAGTPSAALFANLESLCALAKADKFIVVYYTMPCTWFELGFAFDWNRVAYNSLVRQSISADYIVDLDNDWNPADYLTGSDNHPSNIGGRRIAELTAITLRGENITNRIAWTDNVIEAHTNYSAMNVGTFTVTNWALAPYALWATASTNYTLDVSKSFQVITCTNDVCIVASTNRVAGSFVTVKFYSGGTGRNLSFNANWKWLGTTNNPPTIMAADKVGILSILMDGTYETNIVAGFSTN